MNTLRNLCEQIAKGYASGLTMYDAPMIGHAEDLSNRTAEIVGLLDLVHRLVEWAGHTGGWDAPVWTDAQAVVECDTQFEDEEDEEDEPEPATMPADSVTFTPAQALKAIRARIHGVYDDPDLMRLGPLFTDDSEDIARILDLTR